MSDRVTIDGLLQLARYIERADDGGEQSPAWQLASGVIELFGHLRPSIPGFIDVPCPRCGALPGKRCMTRRGLVATVAHAGRWRLYDAADAKRGGEAG